VKGPYLLSKRGDGEYLTEEGKEGESFWRGEGITYFYLLERDGRNLKGGEESFFKVSLLEERGKEGEVTFSL